MLKTIPEVVSEAKKNLTIVTAIEAVKQCAKLNGLIIDVREPTEFAQKSASGVINIPRGLLEMKMLQLHPGAELAIFIHCATGARAIFSAEQLKRVGYSNVSVITCHLDDICAACE